MAGVSPSPNKILDRPNFQHLFRIISAQQLIEISAYRNARFIHFLICPFPDLQMYSTTGSARNLLASNNAPGASTAPSLNPAAIDASSAFYFCLVDGRHNDQPVFELESPALTLQQRAVDCGFL